MLILFTDTDTDFTPAEAKKFGYHLISMPYSIDGKEIYPYEDFTSFDYKTFYTMLRNGTVPKTSALSPEKYYEYFEPFFRNGDDILYVHFSKEMSGTFNALNIAIEDLKEKYPERKFYTIDTKAITIGSYIIVKEIGKLYLEGKNIDELLKWAKENVDHYAMYFFAEDLKFFKRSGRISNFSAIMGSLIGIKPIIYLNNEGKLVSIGKERGRKAAIECLVKYVTTLGVDLEKHLIVIGHTDAGDIPQLLGDALQNKFNNKLNIEYIMVNPTAGSHCGPSGVGVSFYAIHR